MLLRNISLLEEKEKSPISNHRLACAGGGEEMTAGNKS